jgi:hypothetical protein
LLLYRPLFDTRHCCYHILWCKVPIKLPTSHCFQSQHTLYTALLKSKFCEAQLIMADQLGHGWGKSDVLRNDIASDSRHPASCSVPIENLSTELTEAHHCNGLEDGERNTYPKGMRLFTIILAIALSMFLIALVR